MVLSIFSSLLLVLSGVGSTVSPANTNVTAHVIEADSSTEVFESKVDAARLEKAIKGLESSLDNKVTGVVESAIYQAMLLKMHTPKADLSKITNKLVDLSVSHDSQSIRVKSFLALQFVQNENLQDEYFHKVLDAKTTGLYSEVFQDLQKGLALALASK